MARPIVDLPAPDLADQAQNLAAFKFEIDTMHDLDVMRWLIGRIDRRADLEATHLYQSITHPRPPFRLVVRFRTQSATRFTLIASVAIATAG